MAIYDRGAAIAYAERWALYRNPQYLDFENLGGDCTNFISQCLYAGYGEMNFAPVSGWFYRNGNDRTASWTGVEQLYRFLVRIVVAPGPRAREVSAMEMQPGDIVQLGDINGKFYHSLMVLTMRDQEMLIAAHTLDSLMRPLSDYDYARIRYLHML